MKELLLQFSAYSLWANGLLLDTILQLPEEKHTEEVPSSFNTLQKTLLHMLDAESIWWQRLKLQERITRPSDSFTGDLKDLAELFLKQNRQWNEWISSAQERMLQHEFMYQNTKREQFKQPIHQMLMHLFNHGTYHRGQLITMLRELGVTKLPQTDFIVWSRTSRSR